MSALTFKISSELDAAGFKAAAEHMRTLSAEAEENTRKTKEQAGGLNVLKTAYEALEALGIVEFFKATIEASAEAREQEIQLSQRVEQTGLSYERNKPKLDAFFEALTAQSGIAKDKLIPAFNFLIDRTQSVRVSQELMTTTMGLARGRSMDLASAADIVAGAYEGQHRSLLQLSKMMGLTTSQAKDQELVLATAQERFSKLAVQTDEATLAQGRLKESWRLAQEQIGNGLAGPLAKVLDWVRFATNGFMAFVEFLGIFGATIVRELDIAWDAVKNIFTEGPRAAVKNAKRELEQLRDLFADEVTKIADDLESKNGGSKVEGALTKALVDPTKRVYEKLNAMQLAEIAKGAAEIAVGDDARYKAKLRLLDAETNAQIEALRQQQEYAKLSGEDKAKLEQAIIRKSTAEKRKLWQEENNTMITLFMESGKQMGIAVADSLLGQKDAWKKFTVSVIDMIAQKAEAHIMAATLEKSAELGWLNPAAYANLAIGVGETAAVAGLAELAKGAIQGGGDTSSSGSASSVSAASTSSVSTAPATAQSGTASKGTQVIINVQGDMVNDQAYIQRLVQRITDVVENKDVRLVATNVSGA